MKQLFYIVFYLLLSAGSMSAQPDVLQTTPLLSVDKIRPGESFKVGLEVTFFDEWHINSHEPTEEFLIPTILEFDSLPGVQFGEIQYPPGKMKTFEFTETPISVYDGTIVIWAEATASPELSAESVAISGTFSYQACNDVACLMPTDQAFEIEAQVAAAGTSVEHINQDKFGSGASLGKLQGERDAGNEVADLISGSGLVIALGAIFLGGLALNLTPCVYPIIPITVSFFVGQASGKMTRSFLLALIYVIGMSVTYSVLGVVAAMTGGLLGSSLQNPIVLIVIAAVFLIFAASMFGAFEIRVPTFLNRLAGGSRQGVAGSFLMGLTVGIVAAPCIGPFVISLLTYVAAQGDPVKGFLLFFVLSLGLGLPFLVLGTFSGSVKSLPRSGEWMVWVKKVFGVVMIAMAVYFINPLIPDLAYIVLMTATFIVGGLFVTFLDKSKASFAWFRWARTAIGVVMMVVGSWFAFSAWAEANTERVDWQAYEEGLITQAAQQEKPVLIDFYADWCIPCKQIENTLFTHPDIVKKAEQFVALKADLTKESTQRVKNLRKQYEVLGVPTIILLDRDGKEFRRFTDELLQYEPQEFLNIMDEVLRAHAS